MIKNAYGRRRWTFPGGGTEHWETAADAAKREVLEEVGITLNNITKIGEILSTREFKRDNITVFHAVLTIPDFQIDPDEILEAKWVGKDQFEKDVSPLVTEIMRLTR